MEYARKNSQRGGKFAYLSLLFALNERGFLISPHVFASCVMFSVDIEC
jgi:hypothetical protein